MAGRRDFGSIRKLPSGRIQARFRAPSGRMVPAPHTFPTHKLAADWLAEMRVKVSKGKWRDPESQTDLLQYISDWIEDRDLQVRTRELYRGYLRNHIAPYFRDWTVEGVLLADVRRWRTRLREDGRSSSIRAKVYNLLAAVMRTAANEDLIDKTPCRIENAGSYEQPDRPFVDLADVMRVVEVIEPQFKAVVLVAVFGQLRLGELSGLRRRHLVLPDDSNGDLVVHVRQAMTQLSSGELLVKSPKSQRGRRSVTLPREVLPALQHHLDHFSEPGADGRIFMGKRGGPLRSVTFSRPWKRALEKVKLDPNLRLHDLRHTGGTLAARTGATIRELMDRLGHSSPRAAMIYQHSTLARDRQIASGLGKFLDAKKG